jgi:hypothetical protein
MIKTVIEDNKLPKIFLDTVDWDIINLCIECEFADFVPPGFYVGQAYWYVVGHFPCGWSGPLSRGGRIIIY